VPAAAKWNEDELKKFFKPLTIEKLEGKAQDKVCHERDWVTRWIIFVKDYIKFSSVLSALSGF
jgi:hypothetical protein